MLKLLSAIIVALTLGVSAVLPSNIIPRDSRVEGSVVTITDDILIDGEVLGDVTSWTGNILIRGRVRGDVVSYTGSVTVLPGAHVDGSTMSLNGTLNVDPGALGGSVIGGGPGGKLVTRIVGVFAPVPYAPAGAANLGRWLFSTALAMATLMFCLLLIGAWPNRTAAVSAALMQHPGRAALLGLLACTALTTLAFLLAGVLAATIIGIPISMLLIIALHVPFVLGMAALIQAARATLNPSAHELSITTGLTAIALVLPLLLIGLVSPLAALLLFYILASPGLGAAILNRGGTSPVA